MPTYISAIRKLLCAALLFAVHPIASNASEFETRENIKSAIDLFISNNTDHNEDEAVSVVINQVNHVKLTKCQQPIDVSFPSESNNGLVNAVEVSCKAPESWRVFVPVTIQIMTPVLVVSRMIAAGDIISDSDLVVERFDRNHLYDGYFKEINDVIGLSATKTIMAGTALTKKNLKQLPLVRRNQTITLALKRGTIEVDMIGIAKSDGYLNNTIKILNPTSKKMVDAVVTGKDRVEITY